MNWYKKIAQTPGRFKPKEMYVFPKPIVGPTGASIISYEWKYTFEDLGNDEVKRISDWDLAVQNAETNRDIVHQFVVQLPTGEQRYVSAESAAKILGYISTSKMPTNQKNIMSYVKQLAKLKIQQELAVETFEQYKRDYEKISQMPFPPIEKDTKWTGKSVVWLMGDAWVGSFEENQDPNKISEERLSVLQSSWRDNRMAELGWKKREYDMRSGITNLNLRIKKIEEKIVTQT